METHLSSVFPLRDAAKLLENVLRAHGLRNTVRLRGGVVSEKKRSRMRMASKKRAMGRENDEEKRRCAQDHKHTDFQAMFISLSLHTTKGMETPC